MTYDPSGKGAKKEGRGCTDKICLLIFLAFLGGEIFLGLYAGTRGNPERLLFPTDTSGQVCGTDNTLYAFPDEVSPVDLRSKKALFFSPTPSNDFFANSFCIESCPDKTVGGDLSDPLWCVGSPETYLCDYNSPEFTGNVTDPTSDLAGPCYCPFPTLELFRRCIPDDSVPSQARNGTGLLTDIASKIKDNIDARSLLQLLAQDIAETYFIIGSVSASVVVGCFVWVILLRYFTAPMVYFTLLFVCVALGGFSFYLFYESYTLEQAAMSTPVFSGTTVTNANLMFAAALISGVGLLVLLLLIVVLRKRIGIAVGILKESSQAIWSMWSVFVFPVVMGILLALFFAAWTFMLTFIASSGDIAINADRNNIIEFQVDGLLQYGFWYHMFGLYWISQFLMAFTVMTIAGAIAGWYWTLDKKNLDTWPLLHSFGRTLRYHIGTVALGSFLIAMVLFAKFCLNYVKRQLKGSESEMAKRVLEAMSCCLTFLEKILKYLNRNAYIVSAIYGTGFFASAKKAGQIIISNILRVGTVHVLGSWIIFLSKIGIAVAAGLATDRAQSMLLGEGTKLSLQFAPPVLSMIFAYMISSAFFSIYQIAIDTIIICFCEDELLHDGSPGNPYYMSTFLRTYVNQHAGEAPKLPAVSMGAVEPPQSQPVINTPPENPMARSRSPSKSPARSRGSRNSIRSVNSKKSAGSKQ